LSEGKKNENSRSLKNGLNNLKEKVGASRHGSLSRKLKWCRKPRINVFDKRNWVWV